MSPFGRLHLILTAREEVLYSDQRERARPQGVVVQDRARPLHPDHPLRPPAGAYGARFAVRACSSRAAWSVGSTRYTRPWYPPVYPSLVPAWTRTQLAAH